MIHWLSARRQAIWDVMMEIKAANKDGRLRTGQLLRQPDTPDHLKARDARDAGPSHARESHLAEAAAAEHQAKQAERRKPEQGTGLTPDAKRAQRFRATWHRRQRRGGDDDKRQAPVELYKSHAEI